MTTPLPAIKNPPAWEVLAAIREPAAPAPRFGQAWHPLPSPISDGSDGDGNMLNASIYAFQDREQAEREVSRLRDALAEANGQIEVLQNQIDHARLVAEMWAELARK
jgi:hypothetical protein